MMAEEVEAAHRHERITKLREQPHTLVVDTEVEAERLEPFVTKQRQAKEPRDPDDDADEQHGARRFETIDRRARGMTAGRARRRRRSWQLAHVFATRSTRALRRTRSRHRTQRAVQSDRHPRRLGRAFRRFSHSPTMHVTSTFVRLRRESLTQRDTTSFAVARIVSLGSHAMRFPRTGRFGPGRSTGVAEFRTVTVLSRARVLVGRVGRRARVGVPISTAERTEHRRSHREDARRRSTTTAEGWFDEQATSGRARRATFRGARTQGCGYARKQLTAPQLSRRHAQSRSTWVPAPISVPCSRRHDAIGFGAACGTARPRQLRTANARSTTSRSLRNNSPSSVKRWRSAAANRPTSSTSSRRASRRRSNVS